MLTEKERQTALGLLTRSRQVVVDAVDGVGDEHARWKPAPDRWSILEYVEHLAVGEDALVALVKRILESPAQPETEEARREREQKVRETVIPRGANHAPDRMKPAGRYASLQEALNAFLAARERTLEYAPQPMKTCAAISLHIRCLARWMDISGWPEMRGMRRRTLGIFARFGSCCLIV